MKKKKLIVYTSPHIPYNNKKTQSYEHFDWLHIRIHLIGLFKIYSISSFIMLVFG